MSLLEQFVTRTWNGHVDRQENRIGTRALEFGWRTEGEEASREVISLPHARRPEHVALLGKTGSGKSSLLKYFCAQDIAAGRGFLFFDLHGDAVPELLTMIASRERERDEDLSHRTVVLYPTDPTHAVGLNLLRSGDPLRQFVEVAETVDILKRRWALEALGARTEELLRNALLLLAEAGLTLVDLPLILTSRIARRSTLASVRSAPVVEYFRDRYDRRSDAMQDVFREAVLNKVTVFTADPHFRHVLGQAAPAFSLADAVERGYWVLVSLPKGTLGAEAQTFGSLILARLKDALFARQSRTLFTVYADEFQQLASFDSAIEELFAESRKFGVSIVAANQFLSQYSPRIQHALLSLGTQGYFQLSSVDARTIAHLMGRGPRFAETLSNLPKRALLLKSLGQDLVQVRVPDVDQPRVSPKGLLARVRSRWARARQDVELEIARRAAALTRGGKENLEDWL